MRICTAKTMKAAEELCVKKGGSFKELMENAGKACAAEIAKRFPRIEKESVLVLCGKGNNGGDGFVIASALYDMGARVKVVLTEGEPVGLAAEMRDEMLKKMLTDDKKKPGDFIKKIDEYKIEDFYTIAVDAVFGTGFRGELSEKYISLFEKLNSADLFRAAADIPTGLSCDTGEASAGTFRADITVTFGAMKPGLLSPAAREYTGEVICADIGISDECFHETGSAPFIMNETTAAKTLPPRNYLSHKGFFGKLLIIGGCPSMSGAAAMNVKGALRSGAGLVRLASTGRVIDRIGGYIPECTFLEAKETKEGYISRDSIPAILSAAEKMTCIAVGSGLGVCEDTKALVKSLVKLCGKKNIPLIIDADGLNCLSDCIDIIKSAECRAVLTPHGGELARLIPVSDGDGGIKREDLKEYKDENNNMTLRPYMGTRLAASEYLAKKTGAVIVSKGYPTFIVSKDGLSAASCTGNGGLSRGGSGDVLTGIISGIAASSKGRDLFESACAGAYVFGLAADIAAEELSMTGMLPTDAADRLPLAFKKLENLRQ